MKLKKKIKGFGQVYVTSSGKKYQQKLRKTTVIASTKNVKMSYKIRAHFIKVLWLDKKYLSMCAMLIK